VILKAQRAIPNSKKRSVTQATAIDAKKLPLEAFV
jgi:hypothetical protein